MPARRLAITVPEEVAAAAERAAADRTEGNLSAYATDALRAALRRDALAAAVAAQEAEVGPIEDAEIDNLWRRYGLD
jgi:hypothetical protein